MGIALREPARLRRLKLPHRDARIAEISCERPSGARLELELLNVHVRAPHWVPGVRTLTQRAGQLRGLLRHLAAAPHRRRVLVGDLNATPMWPVYRKLAARLSDAAVLAAERHARAVQPTWGPGRDRRLLPSITPWCTAWRSRISRSCRSTAAITAPSSSTLPFRSPPCRSPTHRSKPPACSTVSGGGRLARVCAERTQQ